jgi:type IV pilus assembly protein PilM
MDELRPDSFEHETPADDEATEATIDADVIDRLAAYRHDPEIEVAIEQASPELAVEEAGLDLSGPAPAPTAEEPRRFGRRREPKQKPAKERNDKRATKVVGLKIGASQMRQRRSSTTARLSSSRSSASRSSPASSSRARSGDPDALGDALKRFFGAAQAPARLRVSNNRIGVRIFEIEGVADAQQLENAIRFRAEEVLPIPLDQAVPDYVVLTKRSVRVESREAHPCRVAYREVVTATCRRVGGQVSMIGIDLEAFALLRSLEAPTERDASTGALIAVAIGHDRTTIAVSTGRHCEFARVLDWGGWSLNVAIARELDRAPSEVESIKRQLSFSHATEVEGLTAEQVTKTRDAVQRALATFSRELVASLQFYQAQPGALGIGEVVLTGGTAHMDGLIDAVGELVGVPVRIGDPFKRVKVGPKITGEDQPGSVAIAIGLGIED